MKRSVEVKKEDQEGPSGKRARTDSVASSDQQKCRPSQVPEYLRDSEFYKSLNIEDDEEFHTPANLMKENMNVDTLQDACDLLETLRYWGSTASISPVVLFAIAHPVEEIQPELSVFETEFPFLKSLFYILDETHSAEKRMEAAMELGMIEVVRHLDKSMEGYTMRAIGLAAAGGHIDCLQHALQSEFEDMAKVDFEVYIGAVANGQLECVKLLDQQPQLSLAKYLQILETRWGYINLPSIAAKHGQLECLKYLHKKGCELRGCLQPAVLGGDMACLQYVVRKCGRNFGGDISKACNVAARLGRIECLKYLHAHRFPLYRDACVSAAKVGSVDCLYYAHQNYITPLGRHEFGHATSDKRFVLFHPNISQTHNGDDRSGASDTTESSMFLSSVNPDEEEQEEGEDGGAGEEKKEESGDEDSWYANRYAEPGSVGQSRMPKEVCTDAAATGSVECLKFFHENGGEWDFLVTHIAALHGHLDCLQYAHENGCPFEPLDELERGRYDYNTTAASKEYIRRFKVTGTLRYLTESVAKREHWDCVEYLILHYPRLTAGLTTMLYNHGKQKLLQLAVDRGCEVSLDVGVRYAAAGDLEKLKFAFDHRCTRSPKILCILAAAGNMEGLQYAFERGCSPSADVCVAAARGGHLQCLKYAREHGCKWSREVCTVAARGGHLDCLVYAHEHGCPWDGRVLQAGYQKKKHEVIKYAKENNCPEDVPLD